MNRSWLNNKWFFSNKKYRHSIKAGSLLLSIFFLMALSSCHWRQPWSFFKTPSGLSDYAQTQQPIVLQLPQALAFWHLPVNPAGVAGSASREGAFLQWLTSDWLLPETFVSSAQPNQILRDTASGKQTGEAKQQAETQKQRIRLDIWHQLLFGNTASKATADIKLVLLASSASRMNPPSKLWQIQGLPNKKQQHSRLRRLGFRVYPSEQEKNIKSVARSAAKSKKTVYFHPKASYWACLFESEPEIWFSDTSEGFQPVTALRREQRGRFWPDELWLANDKPAVGTIRQAFKGLLNPLAYLKTIEQSEHWTLLRQPNLAREFHQALGRFLPEQKSKPVWARASLALLPLRAQSLQAPMDKPAVFKSSLYVDLTHSINPGSQTTSSEILREEKKVSGQLINPLAAEKKAQHTEAATQALKQEAYYAPGASLQNRMLNNPFYAGGMSLAVSDAKPLLQSFLETQLNTGQKAALLLVKQALPLVQLDYERDVLGLAKGEALLIMPPLPSTLFEAKDASCYARGLARLSCIDEQAWPLLRLERSEAKEKSMAALQEAAQLYMGDRFMVSESQGKTYHMKVFTLGDKPKVGVASTNQWLWISSQRALDPLFSLPTER